MIPERNVEELRNGTISDEYERWLKDVATGKKNHMYYKETVEHREDMSVHVEGDLPKKLLTVHRPNETDEVKKYRMDIWEDVTVGMSDKVINTLNRIYNPRFFEINHETEELEQYLNEDFPVYQTFQNFISDTFTIKNLADPNGVFAVLPRDFFVKDTDRFEPVPVWYPSEEVVYFDENYAIFVKGKFDNYKLKKANKIIIMTETTIEVYKMVRQNNRETWTVYFWYDHELGLTAIRTGGLIQGNEPHWFKSFISGVLPNWNRVVTLTSDLDANYNQHLYMERWAYTVDCEECSGKGSVKKELSNVDDCVDITCAKCNGSGRETKTPYGEHRIRHDALIPDQNLPIPPAGYISKPSEIVTIIENRIDAEGQKGYAAINMEILNKVGEVQSGVAKTIDRQDLDAFLERYSSHMFTSIIPTLIDYISRWMFITDPNNVVLPEIVPPKNFSVLSLEYLTNEYKAAVTANTSQSYQRQLEAEIVNKKFITKEDLRKKHLAIINLQPFPGKTVDNLLSLSNLTGGAEDWEIYKSTHIEELVDKAIVDDQGFLDKELHEQREVIDEMAKEKFEDEEMTPPEPIPPPIPPGREEIEEEPEEEIIEEDAD